ncbi:hypothetical protein HYV74_02020 [Candidatus Uhrbacteria bacterium]|nr:hypothetical protein [Candidatus Uhrbacteria bacterium]
MTYTFRILLFVIALSGIGITGCATANPHIDEFGIEAPAWTRLLCSFDEDDRVRSVGAIAGVRNIALARSGASDRARAAVDTCVNGSAAVLRKQPSQVQFATRTMRFVIIELIWRHPVTGVTYALASAPIPSAQMPVTKL